MRALVEPLVPAPWHLFGQSMDGAVAMAHLLDAGYRADTSPYRTIVQFAPRLPQWPRSFTDNSNDETFARFLRHADPLQAKAVAAPWVRAMVAAHNLARIEQKFDLDVHWIPGAKRPLVNESEAIRQAMFAHIDRGWRP